MTWVGLAHQLTHCIYQLPFIRAPRHYLHTHTMITEENMKEEQHKNTAIFVQEYLDGRSLTIVSCKLETYPFHIEVGPSTQSFATTTVVSHRAPQNKTQITPKRALFH